MKLTIVASFLMAIFIIQSCDMSQLPTDLGGELGFDFTPNIPVDVDPALQNKLKAEGDIYALNEAFNEYSWKAFVAINWPRDDQKQPLPKFTDPGNATWLEWKEAFQVYREDGKKPTKWGVPRTDTGLGLHPDVINDHGSRVHLSTSTPTLGKNIADEVDQAFAGKLYDQNGNVVVYEVLMNKAEFEYIYNNGLYNINGQLAFTDNGTKIADFPKGNYEKDSVGATEIKFAWKILEPSDIKERYFVDEGYIVNEQTGKLELRTLGMIGMHISQKTPTGKQWVWSTFEHIDVLDQNSAYVNGKRKIIHPILTDPNCEACPVNLDLSSNKATFNSNTHGDYWHFIQDTTNLNQWYASARERKTQAKRMIDIPVRVENINRKMQAYFKSVGSVWQYYRLIDTQYPKDQNALPTPDQESNYTIPGSVNNKPGGNPNLVFLTNITMETFFQGGNQNAAAFMEINPPTKFQVFGTESCMGCHSSANIYNSVSVNKGVITANKGDQLSADFSWLVGKAKWLDGIPVMPN